MKLTRREFIRRSTAIVAPVLCPMALPAAEATSAATVANDSAQFNVRSHGAKGDGLSKDTNAIQLAIDAAGRSGGTVCFPPGNYLSGTLRLRNRVGLRFESGATLTASPDHADFDPREKLDYNSFADGETTDFNFALLQGRDLDQISLAGPGRIDGNRKQRGGPKPIALKRCRHVLIRDLTITNAPNYNISLLGCDWVDILGVTILNGYCDGIDPDCCRHVRIADCFVESWDDAIVPKASFALGYRHATENVTVTNCVLSTACNALKLGTESSGDFKNIVFSNCTVFARPDLWGRNPISGVAVEMVDGGSIDRVAISNIAMADVRAPVFIRLGNRGRAQAVPQPQVIENVSISDIVATGASLASSITGLPGHPVRQVTLRNIRINARGGAASELAQRAVPELESKYPDAHMFGELPGYGLFCRHVAKLTLDGLQFELERDDARPAVVLDDLDEVDLRAVITAPPAGDEPALWLRSVRDCFLQGLRARPGTKTFLRLSGEGTARVHLSGNDLSAAGKPFVIDPDLAAGAWRQEGNLLPK